MVKQTVYGEQSRRAWLSGVNQPADTVEVTLRLKGPSVISDMEFGSPLITRDGVTDAKKTEVKQAPEEHRSRQQTGRASALLGSTRGSDEDKEVLVREKGVFLQELQSVSPHLGD